MRARMNPTTASQPRIQKTTKRTTCLPPFLTVVWAGPHISRTETRRPIQTRNRKGYHLRTKSQARRIMPSLPPQRSQICPRAHGVARKKVWMNSLHFEISSEWRIRASPCTPTNHTPCIGTKAPLLLEAGAIRAETEAGEEAGAEAANPGDGGARNEVVVVANQTWVFV